MFLVLNNAKAVKTKPTTLKMANKVNQSGRNLKRPSKYKHPINRLLKIATFK